MEAKTDLNFEVYDPVTEETTSLNGTTRNQTDANIRKHFGTIDDFMVSSLASQHGALAFIDEGSTRRKEIIAKFLDLEIFEKKFRMAKENSVEAKVLIKKHEDRSYDEEIEETRELLSRQIEKSETNQSNCTKLKAKIEATKTALMLVDEQISAIPAELIDIRNVREQQKSKSRMLVSLATTISEQNSLVRLKQVKLDTLNEIIDSVDIGSFIEDKTKIDTLTKKITSLNRNIAESNKKIKMLENHEYDPDCRFCSENTFVKDAHKAAAYREENIVVLEDKKTQLSSLKPEHVKNSITRYESVTSELVVVEKELSELKLFREKNKNSQAKIELDLKDITNMIKEYDENKDAIENLEELMTARTNFSNQVTIMVGNLDACESDTLEVVKMLGSCEQKIETLEEQKKEHIDLQNSYAAYDLFMQAMHPNGIAYDVIKKKIPVINEEIAKVLANIVDFEIFFESSGNKFDIFIKHPLYNERPIEMASGAEKTMAAMAIRLSLLSVSSLPKGDLFILDEPGTALDEENMEGFIRILELIKVYFKNVLLISHLDSLKDCVDMQIVIEKKNGYARVNQ